MGSEEKSLSSFKVLKLWIGVFLNLADVWTDIALLNQYYENGDEYWSYLLASFLIANTFNNLYYHYIMKDLSPGSIIFTICQLGLLREAIIQTRERREEKNQDRMQDKIQRFKIGELTLEALPQVMLSMYIVVRYPQTAVGDAGLIFVSLCFSLINASFTLATIFLRWRGELKRMFFGIKVFWLLTRFFWNAVEILSKFAALALLLSLSLKIGFFAMAIICFNRIWIYHFSAEYRSLFAYAKTVATCLIDCVQAWILHVVSAFEVFGIIYFSREQHDLQLKAGNNGPVDIYGSTYICGVAAGLKICAFVVLDLLAWRAVRKYGERDETKEEKNIEQLAEVVVAE